MVGIYEELLNEKQETINKLEKKIGKLVVLIRKLQTQDKNPFIEALIKRPIAKSNSAKADQHRNLALLPTSSIRQNSFHTLDNGDLPLRSSGTTSIGDNQKSSEPQTFDQREVHPKKEESERINHLDASKKNEQNNDLIERQENLSTKESQEMDNDNIDLQNNSSNLILPLKQEEKSLNPLIIRWCKHNKNYPLLNDIENICF